jgi:hypothetical protein
MAATITGASASLYSVLKEFYLGPVQDQLNNSILVTQLLSLDKENLEGLKAVIPLHTSRSTGVGSRPESATLPSAGAQSYKRAEYDLAYHYGRVEVTGQAIAKTKSDSGSFVRAFDSELRRIKDDLALEFARQVYGSGDGIIATVGTTQNSTTVVLSSDEALQKGFLYVNMSIDIGTAADPNVVGTFTITDVDVAASSITVSAAANVTATTHKIFRAGNNADSSVTYEMDAGLQKLISTSANTVGGLNAAGVGLKFWDNQRDTSGGAISLSNLMINYNKVMAAGAKADGLGVLTTPGLVRRLFETNDFKANVRFVNSETMKGGFEKIQFAAGQGTLTLMADRLHPYGRIHFVDKKHIRLFSPADWDFLARDGQPIKWVQDKDAFQAILFRYSNLGTDRRNTSLVMSGLTDTGF